MHVDCDIVGFAFERYIGLNFVTIFATIFEPRSYILQECEVLLLVSPRVGVQSSLFFTSSVPVQCFMFRCLWLKYWPGPHRLPQRTTSKGTATSCKFRTWKGQGQNPSQTLLAFQGHSQISDISSLALGAQPRLVVAGSVTNQTIPLRLLLSSIFQPFGLTQRVFK